MSMQIEFIIVFDELTKEECALDGEDSAGAFTGGLDHQMCKVNVVT